MPRAALLLSALLLASLTWLSAPIYQNYSGYCRPQKRRLSNEDLYLSAATFLNARKSVQLADRGASNIAYASPEQLLRDNPDCCELIPEGKDRIDLISRALGISFREVRLTYVVKYDENGEVGSRRDTKRLMIGTCGEVLD